MKECDIFRGSNKLWPLLHIFRGQDPQPPGFTPLQRSDNVQVFILKCYESCSYTATVLNERMWHFQRGQNIFWPLLHIFMGSWPQPPGSTSLAHTHRMREKQLSVVFEVQEPNFLSLCPFACNTYVVTWKVLKGCKWITALASLHSMRLKKINMLILINVTANS